VLTINGKGEMIDFEENNAPWESFKFSITSLVVKTGVTKIGNNAFYNCGELLNTSIPSTVTSIGNNAFYGCNKLKKITYYGFEEN